jgi:hypothetical protein
VYPVHSHSILPLHSLSVEVQRKGAKWVG